MRQRKFETGGEIDPMEAANASMESQDIARSMAAGLKNEESSKAQKPKNRIVSKKELEESGMSLRDYLNRERGLKRKAEKDPTAGDSPDKAAQEAADAIDAIRDMRTPRYTPPGSAPKQTTQKQKPKVIMPDRPDNSFPGARFASGGSIKPSKMGAVKQAKPAMSSASRRADGIATKGKTRGTMVKMSKGGKYC